MLEFWIKRKGAKLYPATPTDFVHFEELPEGVSVKVKAGNGRSSKHHRLFFGAIIKAFMNWPDSHEFKPQDDEHLRAWLLCKAGYRDVTTHELQDASMAESVAAMIEASINQSKAHGFAVYNNNLVYVLTPKSISWGKLPQEEFNKISQSVSDILKAEINMSLDDFKNQEEA